MGSARRTVRKVVGKAAFRPPGGVVLALAAVVIWVAGAELGDAYPLNGAWTYLYVAAGGVSEALAIVALVRLIRWAGRRSKRSPQP